MRENEVQSKSMAFAKRIVFAYQFLCEEKRNLFFPNNFCEAVPVLARILPRLSMEVVVKILFSNYRLPARKPLKLHIGWNYCTVVLI